MAATKSGGETLRNNAIARIQREHPNLSRDEAYELWKQDLRAKASQGGKHKHPGKGFASNKALASVAGQKGGRISKRRKKTEE